ncbi:single-stranded DNA-binding protein [Chitinophaga pollutisoli]|uniref:Single-stranded DNA-binding protein n=1 Tax=Chitinophaga pollutisoli TaxID=3133966 RepID=A0ABZ2YR97_9BACT
MKVRVTGNIVRDAVATKTKNDNYVINFTIALNESFYSKAKGRYEETDFIDCGIWTSPKLADHLLKGRVVTLDGNLKPGYYFKKNDRQKKTPIPFLRLVVADLKFEGFKTSGNNDSGSGTVPQPETATVNADAGDDLPF